MNIDEHPYIALYLAGCLCALVLMILRVTFFWLLSWMRKDNICMSNMKKIAEPDYETALQKVWRYGLSISIDMFLSWIMVVVNIGLFFYYSFVYLREILITVPEDIKMLRFPLYNNPGMSREAVWAYSYALAIKAGVDQQNENEIFNSVDLVHSYYPYFNPTTALEELDSLKVVSPSLIDHTITRISSTRGDEWKLQKANPQQEEEDEKAFWEYWQKKKDIEAKYENDHDCATEYREEIRSLNNEYRTMLRRRNEWSADDFN